MNKVNESNYGLARYPVYVYCTESFSDFWIYNNENHVFSTEFTVINVL